MSTLENQSALLRLLGSCASILLCIHSSRYFFAAAYSPWRALHNLADLFLIFSFGFAGLVAELFPRESFYYKLLKTHIPFMVSLTGRSMYYILFGMFAVGNYSVAGFCPDRRMYRIDREENLLGESILNYFADPDVEDSPRGLWGFFCVVSGIFMLAVGSYSLYTALRYRVNTSNPASEVLLASPMVNIDQQPQQQEGERIMVPFAPFPTQV